MYFLGVHVGLLGLLFFFLFFLAVLASVFLPGATAKFKQYAAIPLKDGEE